VLEKRFYYREPRGYQEDDLVLVTSSSLVTEMGKAYCRSQVDKENPKKEVRMTIEGHLKGSERSHNHVDRNSKEVGIRKMSDDKFDREMVELRVHLDVLMEFLQKYEEY